MRLRILAATVVLLFGSALVSSTLLREVLREQLDEEVVLTLRKETEEFRLLAAGLDPRTGEPFAGDAAAIFDVYFSREVPDEGESLVALLDGQLYRSAQASDAAAAETLGAAITFWATLDSTQEGILATPHGLARYAAQPVPGGSGDVFIVANFAEYEQQEIDEAVRTQVVIQIGTILLAAAVGYLLAGRVLRPLRTLAETAETISDTDLSGRIPVHGQDEGSRIAVAFNDMLARLERAFASQRNFLNDASHELRAPLTVIRGNLELLELQSDPQDRADTTAIATDEIDRMTRFVEELLLLARAERPDFLTTGPVAVDELTHDLFRKASVLCERQWVLEAYGGGTVVADAQRLTQAVMQLAENACRHTTTSTTVRIGSSVDGGWLKLWVHDDGPGVPPELADRVFDRFVGGPERRPGDGLGLSIVRAIAQAHDGSARLAATSAGGARFEIQVPMRGRDDVAGSPHPS